ncbi:DUF3316 domain-containing protein [Tannerella forsythia]|uniref:DUF3316 domain-containing protein n=1 Tax=Tannerella forsythia TaxID=28112 RepID=A0A3P1XMT3_TANFO|nr:DUF3316 domain-containing protein [Tannerella forsythia]RRD60094.1 DUF3316 domain-containing protein [Tannerella forsythia]
MRKTVCFLFFSVFVLSLCAQADEPPRSVNEATLIGCGRYKIKNTYLSAIKYDGWGINVLNERMKLIRPRISRQQTLLLDLSTVGHPAGTSRAYAGFIDYAYGLHYHFRPAPRLKILAGGSAGAMFGFVYNMQSGNNPAALHVDLDMSLSAAAIYTFRLRHYPLTVRYQTDFPIAGALFSPHYGQSYYEIFGVGNSDGVVQFFSLHNKWALRNYLTVDLPVGNWTVRLGYLNDLYHTKVNGIHANYVSHSFMVGMVKELISLGGKRLRKTHFYQSAYY